MRDLVPWPRQAQTRLKCSRCGNKSRGWFEETVVLVMAVDDFPSPAPPDAVRMPQTPSQWLLARYDRVLRRTFGPQGDRRRIRHDRGSNFDRRLFEVIDDHPGAACDQDYQGECGHWSGQASWPVATVCEDLETDVPAVMFEEIA